MTKVSAVEFVAEFVNVILQILRPGVMKDAIEDPFQVADGRVYPWQFDMDLFGWDDLAFDAAHFLCQFSVCAVPVREFRCCLIHARIDGRSGCFHAHVRAYEHFEIPASA